MFIYRRKSSEMFKQCVTSTFFVYKHVQETVHLSLLK